MFLIRISRYLSSMYDFCWRVSRAVRVFCSERGLSHADFARVMNMSSSGLYSKLNGSRRWTVDDLVVLADLGVNVPEFMASPKRVKQS